MIHDVLQFFPKACFGVKVLIKIVKGGENMAIMLNMLPVEPKLTVGTKNSTTTSNSNNIKSSKDETGFAKVLTNETDKSAMDADSKKQADDTAKMLAAMAGLVSPVVKVPVEPVQVDGATSLVNESSAMQNQVVELMKGKILPQVTTEVTTEVTAPTTAAMSNVVEQMIKSGKMIVDNQVATTVDVKSAQQSQLMTSTTGEDAAKQQLMSVLKEMTGITPQPVTNNVQLQTPMKTAEIIEQLQRVQQKNLENVNVNPISVPANSDALTAVVAAPLITGNNLVKDANKSLDSKPVVTDQVNLEAITGIKKDQLTTVIQPVVESQAAIAVIEETTEKKDVDTIIPTRIAKDSDVFAGILNQQEMKIDQAGKVETKPVTPQPVADPHNIASQIVDQARLVAGNKNTEMIIQLKPEHLGELTFKVTVENGVVSASFHSNNSEVRTVIESTLYQLKQEMATQGLKVDTVGVYGGLGEFFSNGQQRENQQQTGMKTPTKKLEEDFFETLDSIETTTDSQDGVDYRI